MVFGILIWSKRRVNEGKTVDNCFSWSARRKQGVEGGRDDRHTTTMFTSRRRTFRIESRKIKIRLPLRDNLIFWSKRRDSNPRSPVPEAYRSSLLTTFIYFLVLFSPKAMLSDALVRTVSTQSKSVDGQRCGQPTFWTDNPSQKYLNLAPSGDQTVHPVSSFFFCR